MSKPPSFAAAFAALAAALLPLACATTHSGPQVRSTYSTLVVSCGDRHDLPQQRAAAYSCTLENRGDTTLDVRVRSIEINHGRILAVDPPRGETLPEPRGRPADLHPSQSLTDGGRIISAAGLSPARAAAPSSAPRRRIDTTSEFARQSRQLLGPTTRLPPTGHVRRDLLIELDGSAPPRCAVVCLEIPNDECIAVPLDGVGGDLALESRARSIHRRGCAAGH